MCGLIFETPDLEMCHAHIHGGISATMHTHGGGSLVVFTLWRLSVQTDNAKIVSRTK